MYSQIMRLHFPLNNTGTYVHSQLFVHPAAAEFIYIFNMWHVTKQIIMPKQAARFEANKQMKYVN